MEALLRGFPRLLLLGAFVSAIGGFLGSLLAEAIRHP